MWFTDTAESGRQIIVFTHFFTADRFFSPDQFVAIQDTNKIRFRLVLFYVFYVVALAAILE